jgi:UDP-N-acetylmuramoylalanine--D-glutamate ligase
VCTAAAVLNLTQDHLDWHGSMQAYAAAKARIFSRETVQVLYRDDPAVLALARKQAPQVTFGADAPSRPEQYGLIRDGGLVWLAYAEDLNAGQRRRKATTDAQPVEAQIFVHRLMPVDALLLRGRHNALNALAALAVARAIGCTLAPMLHALREYEGEPHRVSLVTRIGAVEYYDDSKGTNVGATVAALTGLGAEGKRLLVILGGDGKGQDFLPLVAPLAAHARGVALIGRDAERIGATLGEAPYPVERCESLEDAVRVLAHRAQPGDAVLLSPACASLDMFRNYAHRADVFVGVVHELAAQAGQPC